MNAVEPWISHLAAVCGAITFALPLLRVLRLRNAPRGRTSETQTRLLRWPLILAFTTAVIAAGVVLWRPIPVAPDTRFRIALSSVGALIYFSGLALYVWGFLTLGAMFGISSSMSSELYEEHRLVESGPFRYVRHPMYLGVNLAALGALLIFRTWAMLLFTLLMPGVIFRAGREERLLALEFGESWEAYTKRVPAWIPRIQRKGRGDC